MANLCDYKYIQYIDKEVVDIKIVQLSYSKTYNLEHKDFKLIREHGYKVEVQYLNYRYRYYIVPLDGDTDGKIALTKAKTIINDSFVTTLNTIPARDLQDEMVD